MSQAKERDGRHSRPGRVPEGGNIMEKLNILVLLIEMARNESGSLYFRTKYKGSRTCLRGLNPIFSNAAQSISLLYSKLCRFYFGFPCSVFTTAHRPSIAWLPGACLILSPSHVHPPYPLTTFSLSLKPPRQLLPRPLALQFPLP